MGKLKLFHGKNRGEFAMTQFFAQIESKGSISWWLNNGVKILLKSLAFLLSVNESKSAKPMFVQIGKKQHNKEILNKILIHVLFSPRLFA